MCFKPENLDFFSFFLKRIKVQVLHTKIQLIKFQNLRNIPLTYFRVNGTPPIDTLN